MHAGIKVGGGGGGIITAKSKITSCGKSNNLWEAKTLTIKIKNTRDLFE